jgi:hypothetical protein
LRIAVWTGDTRDTLPKPEVDGLARQPTVSDAGLLRGSRAAQTIWCGERGDAVDCSHPPVAPP